MTDVSGVHPLPGWLPDPFTRGRLRWWDGERWAPTTAPDWVYASLAPDPSSDIANSRRWCDHASKAFLAQAIISTINALCLPVVMADMADRIRQSFDNPSATPTLETGPALVSMVINLTSLGSLAALAVLAIWAHHATRTVRALRRPTTHSPAWAAAGWFVPAANLWFPYQAVRDLLPRGHPARRRTGSWWACYLLGSASLLVVMVAAFINLGLAMVLTIVPITFTISACVLGRSITTAVSASLADALEVPVGAPGS